MSILPGLNTTGMGTRAVSGGSAPPDANTLARLQLNGADGDTTVTDDVGVVSWTLSGGAVLDNDQAPKFGSTCLHLPTTSAKLTGTHASLAVGTGPLSLAFWLNPVTQTYNNSVFSGATGPFYIRCLGGVWDVWVTGASEYFTVSSSNFVNGSWQYVMFTRDSGGTGTLYVDGVSVGSSPSWGSINMTKTTFEFAGNSNCYLDDIVVSDVVRDPTPPTSPF